MDGVRGCGCGYGGGSGILVSLEGPELIARENTRLRIMLKYSSSFRINDFHSPLFYFVLALFCLLFEDMLRHDVVLVKSVFWQLVEVILIF